MPKAERTPRLKGPIGPRLLFILGVGIAAVTVGALGGTLTLVAFDGGRGSAPAADAATHSSTPALTAAPGTTVVATTPSGSPAPAITPDPGTGGDQPTGPLPATSGDIAENVGLSPAMAEFRDEMSGKISDYENSVGIDVGFAVTDLQTGETMSVGGNVVHKTGCVINLFGLFAAVDAFQSGEASPSGLEYSIRKGIGGSYPPEVKNFLDAIYGYYPDGVERARELMSQWGLKIGYYDHIPYYGGGDSPPPNVLTPLEVNSVLTRLWDGQLFNAQWTNYTIGVLRDSYAYVNYVLQKYLPYSATVGHKIGYYWDDDGWVNNDVGIVSFAGSDGSTKAYAVSYFSQYAPSEVAGYSFGQKLSLDAYNFMASRYGVYEPPAPPTELPAPTDAPTAEPTSVPTAAPTPTPTIAPTPARSASPTPKRSPTPTPH